MVLSVCTITWLYIPEVIQPNKIALSTAIIWLMGAFVTFLYPLVRNSCGDQVCPEVFAFLGACMAVETVVCYFCMVETKDKTELEIRELFNAGKI